MAFKDYPFSPPNVRFITKMFHPNISEIGDL
jgi:ubiquitin-protein ligase